MVFLFGRRISSPHRFFFVRLAHPIIVPRSLQPAGTSHRHAAISLLHSICLAHLIAAPHSLCPAGASHHRAAISSAGRLISSPHRNLFAAIYSFAGAFATDPPILCWSIWPAHSLPSRHRYGDVPFDRRIPRQNATDLVLFCLAGAFPAEPPLIWCCSIWPAHSPPSRHRFGVVLFGRHIPCRAATDLALFHLAGAFPADLVSSFAGAFAANPPIWCCFIWLVHPLATPPLPILAVAPPRCANLPI